MTAQQRAAMQQVLEALVNAESEVDGLLKARDSDYARPSPETLAELRASIATLTAALAEQGEAGWRPIETAPKGSGQDGPGDTRHPDYVRPPRVLLATAEGVVVGYYDWYYHPGYGAGAAPDEPAWREHDGGRTFGVTHWMPLPAAPGATPSPAAQPEVVGDGRIEAVMELVSEYGQCRWSEGSSGATYLDRAGERRSREEAAELYAQIKQEVRALLSTTKEIPHG